MQKKIVTWSNELINRIGLGDLLTLYLLPKLNGLPHEPDFLYLKSLEPYIDGDIVDVGANVGQSTSYFLKIFKKSNRNFYVIEPNPNLFKLLNRRFKKFRNVKVLNVGAGNNCNSLSFCIPKNKISKSTTSAHFFHEKSDYCSKHKSSKIINEIKIIDINSIQEKIGFLKIDVEGFEVEVLKGARNHLHVNKPILLVETVSNSQEIKDFLNLFGYSLIVPADNLNEMNARKRNSFYAHVDLDIESWVRVGHD